MMSVTVQLTARRRALRAPLHLLYLALILAPGSLFGAVTHASEYPPPTGFNGHTWGTPLTSFKGVSLLAANTALGSRGKVVSVNDLGGRMCPYSSPQQPCLTPDPTLFQTEQVDGVGSYALAEYYFASERHPWPGKGIDLYTISYLFCAGSRTYLPKHIKDGLKLCGARVMFHSDDLNQLASRPSGFVTNERRILQQLIDEYGEPPKFHRQGRILIDPNGDELSSKTPETPPEYTLYRWCGLPESSRSLHPACPSTVTFVFNETQGVGMVLYATNPMYDYAYARHVTGDDNNDLYIILNSPRLDVPYRRVVSRGGTQIHVPQVAAMSQGEYREFQP